MSISGPLRGKKTYLKRLFETTKIKLLDIQDHESETNWSVYEFMWDTPTPNPLLDILQMKFDMHFTGVRATIIEPTLNTEKNVRVIGRRGASITFRHSAKVEFEKLRTPPVGQETLEAH